MSGGLAYDGDLGEIVCNGTSEADEIIVISLGGDPIAFGYVAGSNPFCCDATELDDDTHDVWIGTLGGNDIVCLHDSSNGSCSDNVTGDQYWSNSSEIHGGDGDDFISTSKSTSVIVDLVYGGGDDDTIYTHAGADEVYGGSGDDEIYGGDGADVLYGEGDEDTISGQAGADEVSGGTEGDIIYGGTGKDELCGDTGLDYIYGAGDEDCICGRNPTSSNTDGVDDILRGDDPATGDDCYEGSGEDVSHASCDATYAGSCLCACP